MRFVLAVLTLALTIPAPALAGKNGVLCWFPDRSGVLYSGKDTLTLKSAAEVAEWEAERAALELRPVGEPVFKAGMLAVRIERIDIDHADAKLHKVIIQDAAGEVILRQDGEHVKMEHGRYWSSYIIVGLTDQPAWPIQVHSIDNVLNKKCVWSVAQDGKIELVEGAR